MHLSFLCTSPPTLKLQFTRWGRRPPISYEKSEIPLKEHLECLLNCEACRQATSMLVSITFVSPLSNLFLGRLNKRRYIKAHVCNIILPSEMPNANCKPLVFDHYPPRSASIARFPLWPTANLPTSRTEVLCLSDVHGNTRERT
jgi:hypothetical protein